MKRVLFIAYLFPPIANSGTMRPLKFVKYLAEHGWEPTVLTAASFEGHATDAALLEQIPPAVRVIRVPLLSDRIADGLISALGGTALGRKVGNGMRWRIRNRRRLPDLYAWWQPLATRAAMRIFRETGFDAIYATGFPWTALTTGAQIAHATGRPLVADFRDPWAGEVLFPDERPPHEVELRAEREVVSAAAAVVGASEGISRMLIDAHPDQDAAKFITVNNGFDPGDFDVPPQPRTADKLRIVYTGVWNGGHNPGDLYTAVDRIQRTRPELLERLEVIMAGFTPGEAQRRGLERVISERARVPHREAIALMRSADLLYFPHTDAVGRWAVPGKLYEYLATGVPVLAHTALDTDSARILKAVGGAIFVSREDPGHLSSRLIELCSAGRADAPQRNAAALRAFERRTLTGKLAGVLRDVSSQMPASSAQQVARRASMIADVRTR